MNGKEVRALKDEEIKIELERTRAKLYQLRTQTVTEKVENTGQFKEVRRNIARLLTERQARHLAKNPRPVAKVQPAAKGPKSVKPIAKAGKEKAVPGKKKSTKPAANKA